MFLSIGGGLVDGNRREGVTDNKTKRYEQATKILVMVSYHNRFDANAKEHSSTLKDTWRQSESNSKQRQNVIFICYFYLFIFYFLFIIIWISSRF